MLENGSLLPSSPNLQSSSLPSLNNSTSHNSSTNYSSIPTEIRTSIDFWLKNLILKKMVKARNDFLKKKETVKKLEEHKVNGTFPVDIPNFTGYNQYPLSLPEDRRVFYREREKQSYLTFKLLDLDIRLEGHIEDRENSFEVFNNLRSIPWILDQAAKIWPAINENLLMKEYIQEGATFLIDHVSKNKERYPLSSPSPSNNATTTTNQQQQQPMQGPRPTTPFEKRFARLDINDQHIDDDASSFKSFNSSKSYRSNYSTKHHNNKRSSHQHNQSNNNNNHFQQQQQYNNNNSNNNNQHHHHHNNNNNSRNSYQPPRPPPPPTQQNYQRQNNNNYHQQENFDQSGHLNSFGRGRGFTVHQRADNFHSNRERSQSRSNRWFSSNSSAQNNHSQTQSPVFNGPRAANQNSHQFYSNNHSNFHQGGDQNFGNQGRGNHGPWRN
jgi:hypothetical protein